MNDIINDQALTRLGPVEIGLVAILARPKPVAIFCVLSLAALGWASCGLMLASSNEWLDALCRPAFGRTLSAPEISSVAAMWAAMTLAMMLPTAGPMILTYAEIADTAARKREHVVSPLVLAAGYTAVWLGFASIAALLQWALASAALVDVRNVPAPLAGALFVAAGLYQFSPLKHACLTLCQRPFPFFFANWTTTTRGVFKLGLRQGLYCLGCCWALMLVMFAVGSMNVLWMAALGALMTIEKMTTTAWFSRALGVGFIAVGAAFVAMEFK